MAELARPIKKKQDDVDQKHRVRQPEAESSFDRYLAYEQGTSPVTETPFRPQVDRHAALLAAAQSNERRANLAINLQQTYGNRYVQRLLNSMAVQAKLTVNAPNDIYEQEADRVADTVTRALVTQAQRQEEEEEEEEEVMMKPVSELQRQEEEEEEEEVMMKPASELQRQEEEEEEEEEVMMKPVSELQRQEEEEEEEEEVMMKPVSELQRQEEEEEEEEEVMMKPASELQRQEEEEEEEEEVQAKATDYIQRTTANAVPEINSEMESEINASRGSGQPLSEETRRPMEQAFGTDFSSVRVHTGPEADMFNRQLNARAFTTGQDIFFRSGQYNPAGSEGRKLLAHELTHTIQQTGRKAVNGPQGDTQRQFVNRGRVQGIIQRVRYLHLRKRRAQYATELTAQRPNLIDAIRVAADDLKIKYQEYRDKAKRWQDKYKEYKKHLKNFKSIPSYDFKLVNWAKDEWRKFGKLLNQAKDAWKWALKFIRKQDVDKTAVTDKGDFDPSALAGRLVEYDAPTMQKKSKITVTGGKLIRANGNPVDTADSVTFQKGLGWEIFVMSPTGDIHMESHKIGKYHHSSLLAGADVASAGMMQVENGDIRELSNHSGHYAPGVEHVRQILQRLSKQGVPLTFNLNIEVGGTAINQPADIFWAGPQGEQRYETEKTVRMWDDFVAKYTQAKVIKRFTSKKWTVTQIPASSGIRQVKCNNPGGTEATQKEIREFLKANFGWKIPGFFKKLFSLGKAKKTRVPVTPLVTQVP
jgi:hypothetical protein